MPIPSSRRASSGSQPELLLLTAVFEDALRCVRGWVPGLSGEHAREANEWFASDRRDWPFAFLNVCDILDLDPLSVRAFVNGRRRRVEAPVEAANEPAVGL